MKASQCHAIFKFCQPTMKKLAAIKPYSGSNSICPAQEIVQFNPLPAAGRCIDLLNIIFQISANTTVGNISFSPLDGGFRRPNPPSPNTSRRFCVTTEAAVFSQTCMFQNLSFLTERPPRTHSKRYIIQHF